ncbi:hypothetical protein BZG36_02065 [Bifiguratus adelaidae]|uniref:Cyclin N-terminal domain-containing protein n=1 Tax=Bifiguratus adelaidae TaxID=1938954 RepID=A0A261Y209_9FUNG|nr:hypothetical protein BZG36_02065 [Bifiguratus adelaidae]
MKPSASQLFFRYLFGSHSKTAPGDENSFKHEREQSTYTSLKGDPGVNVTYRENPRPAAKTLKRGYRSVFDLNRSFESISNSVNAKRTVDTATAVDSLPKPKKSPPFLKPSATDGKKGRFLRHSKSQPLIAKTDIIVLSQSTERAEMSTTVSRLRPTVNQHGLPPVPPIPTAYRPQTKSKNAQRLQDPNSAVRPPADATKPSTSILRSQSIPTSLESFPSPPPTPCSTEPRFTLTKLALRKKLASHSTSNPSTGHRRLFRTSTQADLKATDMPFARIPAHALRTATEPDNVPSIPVPPPRRASEGSQGQDLILANVNWEAKERLKRSNSTSSLWTVNETLGTANFRATVRCIADIIYHRKTSGECAIITMIYLDRMQQATRTHLFDGSWRYAVLGAFLLAVKVWDDFAVFNGDFAGVARDGVPFMNTLESWYLKHLDYDVSIKASLFAMYYFYLRDMGGTWSNDLDVYDVKNSPMSGGLSLRIGAGGGVRTWSVKPLTVPEAIQVGATPHPSPLMPFSQPTCASVALAGGGNFSGTSRGLPSPATLNDLKRCKSLDRTADSRAVVVLM